MWITFSLWGIVIDTMTIPHREIDEEELTKFT